MRPHDTTVSATRRLCLPLALTFVLLASRGNLCGASSVTWTHLSTANGDLDPPNSTGIEQTCALILDIDKNGLNDFVVVERTRAPSVVWYRRSTGGWTKYVIEDTRLFIEAGGAFHDIDGDGDLDVAFGGDATPNTVWWWENPHPSYSPNTPWTRRLIKSSGDVKHHDQAFGDVDGDGRVEFITWNQGAIGIPEKLLLIEIPVDPRNHVGEWPRSVIFTAPDTDFDFEGLAIGDVDLDGKMDIVGAGRWFRHVSGTTFETHLVDGDRKREWSRSAVGQLVPGGRPEIVIAPGDSYGPLKWYSWNGTGWNHHVIRNDVEHGHSLALSDINADGKLDVFIAEMGQPGSGPNCRTWVYYGDGTGQFTGDLISTGIGNHESKIGDLDGDGDFDILSKPYKYNSPRLDIWLNGNGEPPPPPPPPPPSGGLDAWTYVRVDGGRARWGNFDDPSWLAYFGLGFGYIDGNGLPDLVSGRYFYRNPGGNLTSTWQRIDFGLNVDAFLVLDVDGDAYGDAIGTRGADVYWLEANDTAGNSWTSHRIDDDAPSSTHVNPQGYVIADVVRGGRPEILISNGDVVFYYQIPTSNPEAGNWPMTQILAQSNSEGIGVADIDRDGYLDVAVPHSGGASAELKWARNPRDGSANWATFVIGQVSMQRLDRVAAADLNGDGRADVICTEENASSPFTPATTYWFEAPSDPTHVPWVRHSIVTQYTTNSMDVADMDGDGDMDVVLQEHRGTEKLAIWANDGNGHFTEHVVDTGKEGHLGARVGDLDGDGDKEIFSIAFDDYSKLHLWRNDNGGSGGSSITCYKDVDRDGYGAANTSHTVSGDTCPSGEVTNGNDCLDTDAHVNPGETEVCGNGIDDDCAGGDEPCVSVMCYPDADGDDYGDENSAGTIRVSCTFGEVEDDTDCNDADNTIRPGAAEFCDGKDNDCDGKIDEGISVPIWYRDGDHDRYGNPADSIQDCIRPAGYVANSTDCDDQDSSVNPGRPEVCENGVDDDCSGSDAPCGQTWYRDADRDGFGDPDDSTQSPTQPLGYVFDSTDCDDTDASVNPGADEVLDDEIDQDCDGVDETSDGGIEPGSGGSEGLPSEAEDLLSVEGEIGEDGTFEATLETAEGQVMAHVTIIEGEANAAIVVSLKDNGTPGPEGAETTEGFDAGQAMARTLTVFSDAEDPGLAIIRLTFTAAEVAAAGLDPSELELHVLDEESEDSCWVPAGVNISPPESLPTVLGETGFYTNADGTEYTYWSVNQGDSSHAVGKKAAPESNEPTDSPAPDVEPEPGQPASPDNEPEPFEPDGTANDGDPVFISPPLCGAIGVFPVLSVLMVLVIRPRSK